LTGNGRQKTGNRYLEITKLRGNNKGEEKMTGIRKKSTLSAIIFLTVLVMLSSCGSEPAAIEDPTATPTPTKIIQVVPPTQTATPSRCAGLAGELEIMVLVGPAEVVGLEPYSVGTIPFSVVSDEAPYLIQGGGNLDYADILTKEWGTYEVTLNLDFVITGNCNADGNGGDLALAVEMTGSQMVEVNAEGFHGEYPWQGTYPFEFTFPLEEGASYAGEGFTFVLHLK
jgi:hypothetical protein